MPDLATLVPLVGLLVVSSAFAGLIAGLLGVGGGIVLVPAFLFTFETLGFASPELMQICLATSLATIIITSMRSVAAHHRKGAVDWPILKRWAPGIALGAIVGVLTVSQLEAAILKAMFGVIAIFIGLYFAFGKRDWRLAAQMPGAGLREALAATIGFLSVLMGIGGGSFAGATDDAVLGADAAGGGNGGGLWPVDRAALGDGVLLREHPRGRAPAADAGLGQSRGLCHRHFDDIDHRADRGKAGAFGRGKDPAPGVCGVHPCGGAEHAAQIVLLM